MVGTRVECVDGDAAVEGCKGENARVVVGGNGDRALWRADQLRTREIAGRWGAPHELVPVDDNGDPDNHVIAGDALSPSTTAFLAQRIVVWVKAITE